MSLRQRLHDRAHHRGLHGREKVNRERLIALVLIYTALGRVGIWTVLMILYLIGVAFAVALFKSVAFVALLSILALILTDWGQFAASMAQLTAGHAHQDIEHTRRELSVDTQAIQESIDRLARLPPGPDSDRLAREIRDLLVA